jgi:DNA-binding XRE family transcriptional regulator
MKSKVAGTNVQFIQTPEGHDLAVLPRKDYDRLMAIAAEARDDAVDANVIKASLDNIKRGREIILPRIVMARLDAGDNAVRVMREWREMPQGELAVAVEISQSYLSEIESGRRKGPAALQKKLARALGVPIDLLID